MNLKFAIESCLEAGYPRDYLDGKIIALNIRGTPSNILTPRWQVFSDEEDAIIWQCSSPETRQLFFV